jgi:hypothetical protein
MSRNLGWIIDAVCEIIQFNVEPRRFVYPTSCPPSLVVRYLVSLSRYSLPSTRRIVHSLLRVLSDTSAGQLTWLLLEKLMGWVCVFGRRFDREGGSDEGMEGREEGTPFEIEIELKMK